MLYFVMGTLLLLYGVLLPIGLWQIEKEGEKEMDKYRNGGKIE